MSSPVKRREVLKLGAVAAAVATLGYAAKDAEAIVVRQPFIQTGTLVIEPAYIVFQDDSDGLFRARNGGTGRIDYGPASAASVLASVNTALITVGGTAYLKGPVDFGSITWTCGGKTLVLKEPTVTGLSCVSDGTWLRTVQTIPAPRPYVIISINGPIDGADFGPNSVS